MSIEELIARLKEIGPDEHMYGVAEGHEEADALLVEYI